MLRWAFPLCVMGFLLVAALAIWLEQPSEEELAHEAFMTCAKGHRSWDDLVKHCANLVKEPR
jgi:hypothetical protein